MALAEPVQEHPEWTLGDRLRKARVHAGLDQNAMAERLGVSGQVVSRWETDRGRPRDVLAVVKRWAQVTAVPEAWLLGLVADGGRRSIWRAEGPGHRPALRVVEATMGANGQPSLPAEPETTDRLLELAGI